MGKVTIQTKKDTQDKLAIVQTKGTEYFILADEFNKLVIALNTNYEEFSQLKAQKFLTEEMQQTALQNQLETIYTLLIGNNNGSLASLATENKQNLIVAINEVTSLVKAIDLTKIINDELENSSEKTYSIDRIKALINEIDLTLIIDDKATGGVQKTWSVDGIKTFVSGELGKLIGAAPEALNTLQELATELQENDTVLEQILSAQAKRLRVDDSQGFTEAEKTQGRTNLDVYSKIEVDSKETALNNKIATVNNALNDKVSFTDLETAEENIKVGVLNELKSANFDIYKRGISIYSKNTTSQDYGYGDYQYKHLVFIPVKGIEEGETVSVEFTNLRNDFYSATETRNIQIKNRMVVVPMYCKNTTTALNNSVKVTYKDVQKDTYVNSMELSQPSNVYQKVDFTSYSDPSSYTIGTKFSDLKTKDFVVAGKNYNREDFNTFTPEQFSEKGLDLNNMWTMILLGNRKVPAECKYGGVDYKFLMEYEAKEATRIPQLVHGKYNADAYIQDLIDRGFSVTYDNCVFTTSGSTITTIQKNGINYILSLRDRYVFNGTLQPTLDFSGVEIYGDLGGVSPQYISFDLQNRSVDYTALQMWGITVIFNAKRTDGNILDRLDYAYLPLDLLKTFKEQYVPAYDSANYRKQYVGLNIANGYIKNYYG